MARGRKLFVALLIALFLSLLLPVGWFVWRAWRALPDYEGDIQLAGLRQPVRILRDARAVPHIYAQNGDDLLFAQGYVHAQERLWQMDLLRRTARGELSEIFGPATLEADKQNRRLGLGSVADRAAEALDENTRWQLEAYARGVNAFIESRRGHPLTSGLPVEFALLRYRPKPWQPADSLVIGLNLFKLLYNRWRTKLARTHVEERVGPERAADLFVSRSDHDHPIAERVERPRRPRRQRVFVAYACSVLSSHPAPFFPRAPLPNQGKGSTGERTERVAELGENVRRGKNGACRHRLEELLADEQSRSLTRIGASLVPARVAELYWFHSPEQNGGRYGASNNWVVAGAHTASGAAMLANDTHLPHSVPAIWFINHLQSAEVDVAGFSLPGIPWVIIGHNRHIAWGVTNLMADTQDLFIERFHPDDPSRYMTPTGWQRVERRREPIAVRGGDDVDFEVLETRHGPIVHDDGEFKLALQWTARELSALSFSFFGINQAQNWEEFTRALRDYGGPPQNFIYADADGNIGYHVAGRIPLRRSGRGQVPVPGDSNQFEWIGYVPFEHLPQAFNPPAGVLATANNRVIPDEYPYYITDAWIAPARIARIYQLLQEEKEFTPEDFLRIQGDTLSLPDRFLGEQLLAAAARGAPHPPERVQAFATLAAWDGSMRAEAAAPLLTSTTHTRLLEELLRPHLGEDWQSYSWLMAPVFLENVLSERPARWLPENYQSYDELLLAALDGALEQLQRETRVVGVHRLRWGEQMRVRFRHPVGGRFPLLRRWLSVGGSPQAGGRYSVKQTGRTYGPSERFVVDFADLDATRMNITLGQSGHLASPHYKDQFSAWLAVRSFPTPFTDAAVERAARHTLHLLPR